MEKSSVIRMELRMPPLLGTTAGGRNIHLGGLSGLRYLGPGPGDSYRFLTHTDRGPNPEEREEGGQTKRPFVFPSFQPRIVVLEAHPKQGFFRVEKEILLRRPDGKALSGMPQAPGQEVPEDLKGERIPLDPYGMDLEGIVQTEDGHFWMVEEYGPTVARFSPTGKLLETLKPGNGLPKVLEQRRLNRGFEGAALLGDRLYAMAQSPLDNPVNEGKNSKRSRLVRIVEVDLLGRRTLGQYVYPLSVGADRIGDIAMEGPRRLLVLEHDGDAGRNSSKRLYRVNLEGATNLQLLPERISGPGGSLEGMNEAELAAAGITPAKKEEYVDLVAAGITEEKVEGVDVLNGSGLAFVVDNDFGLDGSLNEGEPGWSGEPSVLYILPEPRWIR